MNFIETLFEVISVMIRNLGTNTRFSDPDFIV